MFEQHETSAGRIVAELSAGGYWPAVAAKYLSEGTYSKAVEVCKEHLAAEPESMAGRSIYARALFCAGQKESAAEQFYHLLSADPNHLVALKYLGDIMFAAGDEAAALAHYQRVLELDPNCRALCAAIQPVKGETTRTITLKRSEDTAERAEQKAALRSILFYTETIGDLYLAQGYPRLAAEVYRTIDADSENPRIRQKLLRAEEKINDKENPHVKKTH